MQRLKAAVQLAELLNQLVEMLWIAGSLLTGHGVLHLVLADQHVGRFAEGLEQFFAHRSRQIHVELLLQVGDARIALAHHLAAAGLLQPGDQAQLGGFPGSIHTHQADAVARLHLPGDIPQHLASGIKL